MFEQSKLANALKQSRINAGYKVQQVSDIMTSEGFEKTSVKTIYSWESGNSQPSPDYFLRLCELYGVSDILGTFGYKTPNELSFTSREMEHIKKYRSLDDFGKKAVDSVLNLEKERIAEQRKKQQIVYRTPIAARTGIAGEAVYTAEDIENDEEEVANFPKSIIP